MGRRLGEGRSSILGDAHAQEEPSSMEFDANKGWHIVQERLYPGWVLKLRNAPIDDESAVYMVTMRLTLFWPYDGDAKLTGEDSYSDGEMFRSERITKLDPADVPAEFFQKAS